MITTNELSDFIFENYYKRVVFSKENYYCSMKSRKKKYLQLFATKLTEKIPDSCNVKNIIILIWKEKTQNQQNN